MLASVAKGFGKQGRAGQGICLCERENPGLEAPMFQLRIRQLTFICSYNGSFFFMLFPQTLSLWVIKDCHQFAVKYSTSQYCFKKCLHIKIAHWTLNHHQHSVNPYYIAFIKQTNSIIPFPITFPALLIFQGSNILGRIHDIFHNQLHNNMWSLLG